MYASLHYTGSALNTEALSDIVGLVTGTITTTNQLSANTVTENCTIVNTVLGGWELWDDISAVDKVVRSAVSDDPTKFKYIRFVATGSGVLNYVYKDWDNAAHTGTQWIRYYTYYTGGVGDTDCWVWYDNNNTDTQTLLSSSSNHFAGSFKYDNIGTTGSMSMLSEHDRAAAWDTVENGYIPIVYNSSVFTANTFNVDACRPNNSTSYKWYPYWFIKPHIMASSLEREISIYQNSQYCRAYPVTAIGGHGTYNIYNNTRSFNDVFKPVDQIYDAPGGTLTYQIFPFGAATTNNNGTITQAFAKNISEKCGIFISSMDGTSGFDFDDQVTIGGEAYRVWNVGGTAQKYFLVTEK